MANQSSNSAASKPGNDSAAEEQARVREQIAERLRSRGIEVSSSDSSDDLGSLLEAVEAFESAVEARGGDLMVDEPPEGETAEPDNPDFVVPERTGKEAAPGYIARINAAAAALRQRPA
jgi:hypothetical protein